MDTQDEREIEKIIVRVAITGDDRTYDFECAGVNMDDCFVNLILLDNTEEDLVSINKEHIKILSSKKIYKD